MLRELSYPKERAGGAAPMQGFSEVGQRTASDPVCVCVCVLTMQSQAPPGLYKVRTLQRALGLAQESATYKVSNGPMLTDV